MLTTRGWWFLSAVWVVVLLGVAGLGWWSARIPLLALTLAAWFGLEWLWFAIQYRSTLGRIEVRRSVIQAGREIPAIWAGATYRVRVEVSVTHGPGFLFAIIDDIVAGGNPLKLEMRATGSLRPGQPLVVEYERRIDTPGVLRFEGVQFRFADTAGFFYRRIFLRCPDEYLVLPSLVDSRGRRSGRKRFNALPPPGLHRLRRPGGGSELLDLRDYRPGDPPKLIAWRPTARRDKLITREFESEVPVRCHLFVDAANSTRSMISGKTPTVARLTNLAAAIAQAATGNRDLVGLTVFDDTQTQHLAPARTASHLIRLTRLLATAAGREPDSSGHSPRLLLDHAYPIAQRLYPDMLTQDVNSRPISIFWNPISDSRMFPVLLFLLLWPTIALQPWAIEYVAKAADLLSPPGQAWQALIGLLIVPGLLGCLLWIINGARGFWPSKMTITSRRKQLSALFAGLDHDGPDAIEYYLNDDQAFADRASRFLSQHRVPVPAAPWRSTKVPVLESAILSAVSRARDNELYVILADLLVEDEPLDPLLAAVRVARARRHQVVVLVPWSGEQPIEERESAFGTIAAQAANLRAERLFDDLRQRLAQAGLPVLRIDDGDAVSFVLAQLDRLRGVSLR